MIKQVFCAKQFRETHAEPPQASIFPLEMLAPGSFVSSGRKFDQG